MPKKYKATTNIPPSKQCTIADCGRIRVAKGFCNRHYKRLLAHADPLKVAYIMEHNHCTVVNCCEPHQAKGFCQKHYTRFLRHGNPYTVLKKWGPHVDKNGYLRVRINGSVCHHHRHIMEQHLGRKLLRTEHLHHKNEDKTDNRIENLQIVTNQEHNKIHKKSQRMSSAVRKSHN